MSKKYAWLTDIHLDFLYPIQQIDYFNKIVDWNVDGVFITGDIANSRVLDDRLKAMAAHLKRPIYFVLGNHDYYGSHIHDVHTMLHEICDGRKFLNYLTKRAPIHLSNGVFLTGVDGWADARYGDFAHSDVILNDSKFIYDLRDADFVSRWHMQKTMQRLADDGARSLKKKILKILLKNPKKIIILTHVPPFEQSCLYLGNPTDDDYLPFFSCKATGDVLIDLANTHSDVDFLVLCGHTHDRSEYAALNNLMVKTGCAEYANPVVQGIIEL